MNAKGLVFAIIGTVTGYLVSSGVEGGLNKAFNPEKKEREDEMASAFKGLIGLGEEDESEED